MQKEQKEQELNISCQVQLSTKIYDFSQNRAKIIADKFYATFLRTKIYLGKICRYALDLIDVKCSLY